MAGVAFGAAKTSGDVVVIDDRNTNSFKVGDFDCSSVQYPTDSLKPIFGLAPNGHFNDGEITAGELWSYFKSQGIDSLECLTLRVDVPEGDDLSDFGLVALNLTIQAPKNSSAGDLQASLGGNTLVMPSYDITQYKAEAQIAFNLGYDFMERFSPESTEKITLSVESKDGAERVARIGFVGAPATNSIQNFLFICLFASFWIFVFLLLFKFTSPQKKTGLGTPQSKRLLKPGLPSTNA